MRLVSFRDAFPILAASSLERSLFFYQHLLGFELTYRWPEEGEIEFAYLVLGGSGLGIGSRSPRHAFTGQPFASGGIPPIDLCIYVDNLDLAIAFLGSHDVAVLMPPATQPWGERICYVADPDGNQVLIIETPAAESPR